MAGRNVGSLDPGQRQMYLDPPASLHRELLGGNSRVGEEESGALFDRVPIAPGKGDTEVVGDVDDLGLRGGPGPGDLPDDQALEGAELRWADMVPEL
jgi:hypothetical protein